MDAYNDNSDNLNTSSTNWERAIAGAASGTVAAIVRFPLDTVKAALHSSMATAVAMALAVAVAV